jgi:cell division transport system permease protein
MTTLRRILREAFTDFFRNGLLSVTATLIMTLALICVGIFMVMFMSTNKAIADLKNKVDIVVNFKDEASESLISQLKSQLLSRQQIKTVRYISKDDALKEFQSRDSVKSEIRQIVTAQDNPLPRGLQIQSVDFAEYDYVSTLIKSTAYSQFIDSSSYDDNKDTINNINNSTSFVEKVGLGLSGLFILIAAMVVFNTVKLAVFFRSKEIDVMRLVGASEMYVKTPFLIEGFLYGFFATLISMGVITGAIKLLGVVSAGSVFQRFIEGMAPIFFAQFWFITFVMLMVGMVIGLGASWLSIRKNVIT